MAQALVEMYTSYNEFWEANLDPRNKGLPFMNGPVAIILALAAYIYFIENLGPKLMKNRRPMELDWFMHAYNLVQVVTNSWLVYQVVVEVGIPQKYNFWCDGVQVSYERSDLQVVKLVYYYFILKLLDFVDTIIMVLRKKDAQASFLHKYHHVGIAVGGWIAAAVLPGGPHMMFFGLMNCSIHAIMYSYYSATIINPKLRQCKYKRHLTEMQLIQFVLAGIHAVVGYFHPTCTFPKWAFVAFIPQDIFMLCMFSDFYIKAYLKPKKKPVD